MTSDVAARWEASERHAKRFHRTLGVNLTMACPLACAHCAVESGPWRRERVDGELLLARLREADAGRLRQLLVQGGEPFLELGLLRRMLALAAERGLAAMVVTSAHWATSPERAVRVLRGLPGLTELAVSADEFHLPWVPLERVGWALRAALECGLRPWLLVRVWDPEADPFLARLHAALGDDLIARVGLEVSGVSPLGRARSLPTPAHAVRPLERDFPDGACDIAHHPVIETDGRVLACCNTEVAGRQPALQLGRLADEPLAAMTERAEKNLVLQAIRLWGPRRLAGLLTARGLGDRLAGLYPRGGICSLCEDIVGKPELVAALHAALEEHREEIELARLVRFGEHAALGEDPARA